MAYSVALVVDSAFGNRIAELSRRLHTWLVDSPVNRIAAQALWDAKSPDKAYSIESGVTLFSPGGGTAEDWCVGVVGTIEGHHNAHSHDPGYTVLEVLGVDLSERIRLSLSELGFTKFMNTADGFRAEKSEPKSPMDDRYELEKSLWTSDDFEVMGWHDARIWAMTATEEKYEFAIDLDYIFKWVHPGPGEKYFRLWVAPVTMVFENAHAVSIEIKSPQGCIEVADLHREDPQPIPLGAGTSHSYRFECQEGTISLRATGYRFYVRREPRLGWPSLAERGGISVERRAIAI